MTGGHNFGDDPVPGVNLSKVPRHLEQEAFDSLGPMARRMLNYEMCLSWCAYETLRFFKSRNVDPKSAAGDQIIAAWLGGVNAELARRIRVETRAGR